MKFELSTNLPPFSSSYRSSDYISEVTDCTQPTYRTLSESFLKYVFALMQMHVYY